MIPQRLVNVALSRAFADCWGPADVRREVLPLAALRSIIRSLRPERLRRARVVLARQFAAGLLPYTPVRYGRDRVALGVIAEWHGDLAVVLDGTNRAVAALRHGCDAIAVTVVRPTEEKPPAAELVTLGEVAVWAEKGPRVGLFRNLDEQLFRPMPEILGRAEREVLANIEEERNGPEGLHLGRAGRLGAIDSAGP